MLFCPALVFLLLGVFPSLFGDRPKCCQFASCVLDVAPHFANSPCCFCFPLILPFYLVVFGVAPDAAIVPCFRCLPQMLSMLPRCLGGLPDGLPCCREICGLRPRARLKRPLCCLSLPHMLSMLPRCLLNLPQMLPCCLVSPQIEAQEVVTSEGRPYTYRYALT